ncbi:MAG: hypothetical protein ABI723_06295 [Bacteroidia bacterium]
MKTLSRLFTIAVLVLTVSCSKDHTDDNTTPTPTDNYLSVADFHAHNGVAMQTYTVSGTAGGSFTTPQGTVVIVPANTFYTQMGAAVTGNVTVQFKDIYKKSDMLLSDISATYETGTPLKSGGEFFIKAIANGQGLIIGKTITVKQPLNGIAADNGMEALFGKVDSVLAPNGGMIWAAADTFGIGGNGSVGVTASQYVFSLYSFNSSPDSGTWCNSDNPNFFSTYPQTTLTIHSVDSTFSGEVFLVFKNQSCMVHVYKYGINYNYDYAPSGLQATVVVIGEKGGELYSAFVPITISNNMTVNFGVTLTTTEAFKAQLETLN